MDFYFKLRDSLSTLDVTKPTPDTTAQLKQKTTECIANLADALALTGHACKDLSQKRRDMHPESAGICAPHVPMSSEWLHPEGSEFHKSLKEARETRRLGQDMRGQASRRGQGQWHRGNSNAGAFLDHQHWKQGGSYSNRRPWTQGKRGAGHQGVNKGRH